MVCGSGCSGYPPPWGHPPHAAPAHPRQRLKPGPQLCINRRLRAIDISIPSASPIVTIAVPP
jgi:hypothetical protein